MTRNLPHIKAVAIARDIQASTLKPGLFGGEVKVTQMSNLITV